MEAVQGRRAGWTLADQAISSLTNVALSFAIASRLEQVQFGAFAGAFIAYLLAMGAARALLTEILAIRYATAEPDTFRRVAAGAVGASAVFGVLSGAIVAAVGFFVNQPLQGALYTMVVALPGLLAQDAWRFAFFAQGKPKNAAINDGVWMVSQVVFVGIVFALGGANAARLILAWGASAWAATLFGVVQMGVMPDFLGAGKWVRESLQQGSRYLSGEWLASTGASRITEVVAGFILGLDELAAYRGVGIVVGPLLVLFSGTSSFLVPEGSRIFDRTPKQLPGAINKAVLLLVGVSLVAIVAMVAIPDSLGELLLGETWPDASKLVLWVGLTLPAAAVVNMSAVGLRVIAQMERSLNLRLVTTPVLVAGVLIGALWDGARGMVILSAITMTYSAVLWWRASTRAVTEAVEAAVAQPPVDTPPPADDPSQSR